MFEVSGSDIANLGDADLRTLVARLALAELRKQGCPLSSVTAGGNQDAADGGLDVRVQCPSAIANPDFVPRTNTGFQVKKPDMPARAIEGEMRPKPKGKKPAKSKGVLRQVISELAHFSGAYIIVSSQGSVADKPLADRRKAMRDALHDLPEAGSLYTDFYDRDRLATWANEYPGIAAWVRSRIGRGLSGWSSIGGWTGTKVAEPSPYLFNDKACLTDERSREREQLTIAEGIRRLRAALRTPKQCIRLIGLSGLGKTRLVQALFESDVGEGPLDPSLVVYTDYSVETDPTAREMARQLVLRGQRAILIVDNCNPATHAELAHICSEGVSNVSLLTIEYDVRDDEPERTEVFRLQSASPDLVAQWIEQSFPDISEIDRGTIADFSDGNFRVARALAETLGKRETLGKLKSRELFERLFQQRNQPDQNLLSAAEDLSLLYSIDGEDTSDSGELTLIGGIRAVGPSPLYAALTELRRRGIAQVRGRWRSILPHAIANPLATQALQRIPPTDFDRFSASLTPRMQKSLSRRLGYLHDSPEAQAAVVRWLRADGPLGDLISRGEEGLDILTNIAPVAPEAVLERLTHELDGPKGDSLLSPSESTSWQYIRLIKALGYEPHMFETAATLLSRFLAAEQSDHKHNSAHDTFAELFHLYLSGTHAIPEQRRAFVRQLANSGDSDKRRCASIALNALLNAHSFTTSSRFDFGARSRDWGWQPKLNRDVWDWYCAAIDLAVELSLVLDDARESLAGSVRELWRYAACHDALDQAVAEFVKIKPWIDGWLAFRMSLRYEGKEMPVPIRQRLEAIIQRLKPSDLLHQARAVVLIRASGGWDISDGEPDDGDVMKPWHKASQMAQEVGRLLAQDPETRREFLTELMAEPQAPRAFECGRGLAEGGNDLCEIWGDLTDLFNATDSKQRNATVLGGFVYEAYQRNAGFALDALDAAIGNPALAPALPYLQARVRIDEDGITRLRRAIEKGAVKANDFLSIANGVVGDAPPELLGALLLDIASLADGVEIALDILHMHFYRDREAGRPRSQTLIEQGRELLCRADFSKKGALRDFGLHTIIRVCCSGNEGEATAREVCLHIRDAMEATHLWHHDLNHILKALFETQPVVALDVFLLSALTRRNSRRFQAGFSIDTPIELMDPAVLRQWAGQDPGTRYPLLGQAISMFLRKSDEDTGLSPLFQQMLDYAPDKRAFLGELWARIHPHTWSGSLADILEWRKAQLLKLRGSPHLDVRQWVDDNQPELDRWITNERNQDRQGEESFE